MAKHIPHGEDVIDVLDPVSGVTHKQLSLITLSPYFVILKMHSVMYICGFYRVQYTTNVYPLKSYRLHATCVKVHPLCSSQGISYINVSAAKLLECIHLRYHQNCLSTDAICFGQWLYSISPSFKGLCQNRLFKPCGEMLKK